MKFKVTVYFINEDGRTINTDREFKNRVKALHYAENELSYEATRRVVCKELEIDQEGDFEFTRNG
jgi:hypothetical protein